MGARWLTVFAAIGGVLALGGCTAATSPRPTSTSPATGTATSTVTRTAATAGPTSPPASGASASSVPSSSPSIAAAADPGRPAGQCADPVLRVTLGPADGAAGSDYRAIRFTNTGRSSCVLRGYPGISVVGKANGTQLGSAAKHGGGTLRDVAIPAGDHRDAQLVSVNISGGGGGLGSRCHVLPGDGYRVYPPHSRRAFFVRSTGVLACSNIGWMTIGVVGPKLPAH